MLRLLIFVLTIPAVAGCRRPTEPVWRAQVLTPAQATRQVDLLKGAGLPAEFESLVGRPVSDFDELLTLANETGTRSTTTLHLFHIPSVGDGGSTGDLVIAADECKITQSFFSYPEY